MFSSFDITSLSTVWVLIALLIFLGILVYAKVPAKIAEALDSKSAKIAADLEEAMRLREEAQSLLAEYERKRREAESEAEEIITKAKDDAKRMKADQKKQLKEMVEARTKAAEAKIAMAEAQAISEVRLKAGEIATLAAQDVMAGMVSDKGDSLVDSALDDIKNAL